LNALPALEKSDRLLRSSAAFHDFIQEKQLEKKQNLRCPFCRGGAWRGTYVALCSCADMIVMFSKMDIVSMVEVETKRLWKKYWSFMRR
jgi:hypothetical protein